MRDILRLADTMAALVLRAGSKNPKEAYVARCVLNGLCIGAIVCMSQIAVAPLILQDGASKPSIKEKEA